MVNQPTRVSCALCNTNIDDVKTVITCTICSKNFHSRCVNVDLRGFHMKKNWVCGRPLCIKPTPQLKTTTGEIETETFWDAAENILDAKVFQYILKQKDELIHELKGKIHLLEKHVELLHEKAGEKSLGKKSDISNVEGEASLEITQNTKPRKNSKQPTADVNKQSPNPTSPKTFHEESGKPENRKNQCDSLQTSMVNNRKREASTTLAKTNIVNKQPIVGKRSDSVTIRASPAKAYLYIRRLAKSTTAADLKGYLVEDFPEVVCEPLENYEASHSRFKVTVNFDNLEKIYNPDYWPNGVLISRFFHPRSPKIQQK